MQTIRHWQRLSGLPEYHGQECHGKEYHGVVTSVSSLRTKRSLGIGDIEDLRVLIDWLKLSGFTLLQLLPLHDTAGEASPYLSVSVFSINPLFVALPLEQLFPEELQQLQAYEALERVDYLALRATKFQILRRLVEGGWGTNLWLKHAKDSFWSRRVEAYARFMALKDFFRGGCWKDWEEPQDCLLEEEIRFYRVIQAVAHEQLLEVSTYARSQGIKLMGDLPILLGRESAEVFFERKLFDLELEVGAPPDQYAQEGQNWGFPSYRWEQMEREGDLWWQERLLWARFYFDLYRLDHVIGFFGLWSIEPGKKGFEGKYLPQEMVERLRMGRKRLGRFLEFSDLLPVGEDLGQVAPAIRSSLAEMGVPGIKVLRWERQWEGDGRFLPVDRYPQMSLAALSTHDSSTLRQWIEQEPESVAALARSAGVEIEKVSPSEKSQRLLEIGHRSGSTLKVNLLVDYLEAFEELRPLSSTLYRLNVPGTVTRSNWTFRYRQKIESWCEFPPLLQFMRRLSTERKTERGEEKLS